MTWAMLVAQLAPLLATGISQIVVALKTPGGQTATFTITAENTGISKEILDTWAQFDAAHPTAPGKAEA